MTTSMMAVRLSTRSAQSKLKAPLSTHFRTGTTVASAPPATKLRKIGQLSAADRNSAPVVTSLAGRLPIRRLPRPATMAASSGPKTMIRMEDKILSLHPAGIVDGDRAPAAEVDDQNGEADSGFAGGNRRNEHREDLAGEIAAEGAERHQVEVYRQQDQLDRHQDDDHVLAVEKDAEHAEHEQDRADDDIVFDADHSLILSPISGRALTTASSGRRAICRAMSCEPRWLLRSRWVSTIAPTMATSRIRPAVSNRNR